MVNVYHQSVTRFFRTVQWLFGASTMGVRTLVVDELGQILLIKHTYMPGWHFPGGGVLRGEPTRIAAMRELLEETGVVADEKIELFGVYFHRVMLANDYIVLYVVKKFTSGPVSLGGEIAEIQWFSPENLPKDLCKSTRIRINEYLYHHPSQDQW